jgi:DNA repair protein RecO (recombination protein O)
VRRVRLYRVSSILIRQRDLGEADRIVILYTRERGKLSAVAKGVKRPRSKLAGGLQLFSHARVQLAAGRSLEVVTQVHPITALYHLREDMRRYTHASYAAEVLDAFTDEGSSDPPLFDLLLGTLSALDAGGDPGVLARSFELKLLTRLGHGPELDVCVLCGTAIGDRSAGFSPSQGGVTCADCVRGVGALRVSPTALRALQELRRLPVDELAARRLSAAAGNEVGQLMRSFVDHRLDRPLRSAEYLSL